MLWAKQIQALIMHDLEAFLFRTVGMNLPLWAVTPAARVHDHLVQGLVQTVRFALDLGEQWEFR